MITVLQNSPWFIFGYFLSCQRWESNFVASNAKQIHTAVWIRLPNLPTEFYDGIIIQKIGNSIGRLLKLDVCTSATLRGRYARLCVELPIDKPVAKSINIEDHKQLIEYEGDKILCKNRGLLGHTMYQCPMVAISAVQVKGNNVESDEPDLRKARNEEDWHTVSFQKNKEDAEKGFKRAPRKLYRYRYRR
ncbi:uncharacterized protein [Nicotiana sylvestris]|uniref:Uncharacterized protein LOC104244502 n=1 Tax=Nicotiana sylvestris TaxID=4096 RepID=A0A1U7YHD7_NICSY|nr:PREDICTED: uncharacterized protein LOC104244502 [Nicotiana sylvestris]